MPKPSSILGAQQSPLLLFDGTAAGTTLIKALWPGANANAALPSPGNAANITAGVNVCGGVFCPAPEWSGVVLDFAAVGAADLSLVVEVGKLANPTAMAQVIDTVTLKSITNSGTIANIDPFTGLATAGVTWRLFDLVTHVSKAQLGQVLTSLGGAEDDTPAQLSLDVSESPFYYVLVTSLSTLTRARCVLTPN